MADGTTETDRAAQKKSNWEAASSHDLTTICNPVFQESQEDHVSDFALHCCPYRSHKYI